MNKYLLYILLLILFGCSRFDQLGNTSRLSDDELIVDELLAKTASYLKKEKGLEPMGSGGRMLQKIKMLELAFIYKQPLDIEDGRKLLVETVETFVDIINNDKRIHPYLNNYPFEPKNVEIRILIQKQDLSLLEPGKLCLLTAINGGCRYDVNDITTDQLKTIYEETFVEAQKKLKKP